MNEFPLSAKSNLDKADLALMGHPVEAVYVPLFAALPYRQAAAIVGKDAAYRRNIRRQSSEPEQAALVYRHKLEWRVWTMAVTNGRDFMTVLEDSMGLRAWYFVDMFGTVVMEGK